MESEAALAAEVSGTSARGAILLAFPTAWDLRHLRLDAGVAAAPAWARARHVVPIGPPDDDVRHDFDPIAFIDRAARAWRGRAIGVATSSDYPGAVAAAAIASELGLPGRDVAARIACSHKYASRLAQKKAAPDATPEFALVDPANPEATEIGFPCFVKPVRGSFSLFARRIESRDELGRFLRSPEVREFLEFQLAIFERMAARYGRTALPARAFIAERCLAGDQVTVEGYVFRGEPSILGVVDSVMHPGTRSFARFDYPSALDPRAQSRLCDVAARVVKGLGLHDCPFNVEMFHDAASGRVSVIEVNPRMCGQFADLYEKVDGTNAYEIAFAIAAGERPSVSRRAGAHACASSVPLRVFDPVRVDRSPDESARQEAEALFPDTLVWIEAREGDVLGDLPSAEDGASRRYAVINVGGPDRAAVVARAEAVRAALGFRFAAAAT